MENTRQLGVLMRTLEDAGYKVSYAYEDLVFIEQTPFLLRFDEVDGGKLFFYAHVDWNASQRNEIWGTVLNALNKASFELVDQGDFSMDSSKAGGENIDITFHEKAK